MDDTNGRDEIREILPDFPAEFGPDWGIGPVPTRSPRAVDLLHRMLPDFPASFGEDWGLVGDPPEPDPPERSANPASKPRRRAFPVTLGVGAGAIAASLLFLVLPALRSRRAGDERTTGSGFVREHMSSSQPTGDVAAKLKEALSESSELDVSSRINTVASLKPEITVKTSNLVAAFQRALSEGPGGPAEADRKTLRELKTLLEVDEGPPR